MSSAEANTDNLTESQKQSAYFALDNGYDPLVYENTWENWGKIIAMFIGFYCFQGLHWWANFELGINGAASSTAYNLIAFGIAVCTIGVMLFIGAKVNKKKLTHEFYTEKISEAKQRKAEEAAKAAQHAAQQAKIARGE